MGNVANIQNIIQMPSAGGGNTGGDKSGNQASGNAGKKGGSGGAQARAGAGTSVGGTDNQGGTGFGVNNRKERRRWRMLHRDQGKAKRLQRSFNFELLGTMFLGMAIWKTWGGMLKSVADVFGFSKLWKAVLISLLAPVMKPIMKLIIKISKWIMGWSPTTKKWVGIMIVTLAIFGLLLMSLSMIGLGLFAIVGLMITFASTVGAVLGGTSALAGSLAFVGAAVGLIVVAFSVIDAILIGIIVAIEVFTGKVSVAIDELARLYEGMSSLAGAPGQYVLGLLSGNSTGSKSVNMTVNNYAGLSNVQQNRQQSSLAGMFSSAKTAVGL